MTSSTVRVFIGIDLPHNFKKQLDSNLSLLKTKYKTFKWVEPENYHLTLVFLGEVNKDKINSIAKRTEKVVFEIPGFNLTSYKLNIFPNRQRIIYLSFFKEQKLISLANKLKQEFQDYLQHIPQNKFIPHITVAKSKRSSKQQYIQLKKLLEKTTIKIQIPINKLYVFSSKLTAHGSIYKKLSEIKLFDSQEIED
ncbi:MAG: RNA 2',3'-cyclic phosphodiesterase [Patescibacteria group bacterium]|nr:MAG: RNA 2',3'-cyclic phosphodiesterase [Patescibacteria group bacterium]